MTPLLAAESKYFHYYFNYADIELEGYAANKGTSSQLLKQIVVKLNDRDFLKGKRVINRYEKRAGTEKRLLVNVSAPFEREGKRVFGKIALIKNKSVFTLAGSDFLEEIEKPKHKEFVEITNYSITFDPKPIIMIEFNSEGPRLSDLEFYFRQISKEARIATSIKTRLHLSIDYKKLSEQIANVFNIEVKVRSNDLLQSKDVEWYNGLRQLKDDLNYKDVKLQFFYPRIKDEKKLKKYLANISGLKFARGILSWLKKNPENIENVDDLKMVYTVEGSDEEFDMDFIKNKTTSVLSIPKEHASKRVEFNTVVGVEFNMYLKDGKVTDKEKE
jgi:hypothetical protein